MRAKDYYQKDYNVLYDYIKAHSPQESKQKNLDDLLAFFRANDDSEYNEFLVTLKEKYGQILELALQEEKAQNEKKGGLYIDTPYGRKDDAGSIIITIIGGIVFLICLFVALKSCATDI